MKTCFHLYEFIIKNMCIETTHIIFYKGICHFGNKYVSMWVFQIECVSRWRRWERLCVCVYLQWYLIPEIGSEAMKGRGLPSLFDYSSTRFPHLHSHHPRLSPRRLSNPLVGRLVAIQVWLKGFLVSTNSTHTHTEASVLHCINTPHLIFCSSFLSLFTFSVSSTPNSV